MEKIYFYAPLFSIIIHQLLFFVPSINAVRAQGDVFSDLHLYYPSSSEIDEKSSEEEELLINGKKKIELILKNAEKHLPLEIQICCYHIKLEKIVQLGFKMADANTDAVSLIDFEIGLMEYCKDHKIFIHLNNINKLVEKFDSEFGILVKKFKKPSEDSASTSTNNYAKGTEAQEENVNINEHSSNIRDDGVKTTHHGVLLYCYKLLHGPQMAKKALVVFANSLTEYGNIGRSGDTVTALSVGNIEETEYCPNGAFMDISDTTSAYINTLIS
uniref:Uncharacterized protein n=1 Tax=Globodera rostochiensis TaxID=31243 RepID=A0A914IBW5_GLORO